MSESPGQIDPDDDDTRTNSPHPERAAGPFGEGQYILYDLDELLAAITDENRHDLIDFGEPVGREVW